MKVPTYARAALAVALCAAGCTTHPPPSSDPPVTLTTTPAEVANCSAVGNVNVSDGDPDAAKNARNQTAALGGNVLLRDNALVYSGTAFHCVPAAH